MTSYRPETSVPSATSEPAAVSADPKEIIRSSKSYILNIFDLVFPASRVKNESRISIPPAFLQREAVDSSLYIGSGASFAVTRQAITLTKQVRRYVVYKSARVRFKADGAPSTTEDRRALLSVLTELHALLHPPLRQHPNIISLLGLGWGSNHAEPTHRLPVLVVEYGDLGTLVDFQARRPNLNLSMKRDLCRGIAHGLQALHDEGIAHGDIKPENIIMCSDENGKPVPKLADFGFSVLESPDETSVYIGGTRIWRAPESFGPVPVMRLPLTDVYSFGLLVWSIAADGKNPFQLVLLQPGTQEEFFKQVDHLKMSDEVLAASQLQKWLMPLMLDEAADGNRLGVNSGTEQTPYIPVFSDRQTQFLTKWKTVDTKMKQLMLKVAESFPAWKGFRGLPFYRCLNSIFSCTLTKDPDRRNLKTVINILADQEPGLNSGVAALNLQSPESRVTSCESKDAASASNDQVVSNGTAQNNDVLSNLRAKIDWSGLGFNHRWYSWQVMRDLEPDIQKFAMNAIMHLHDAPARFVLCAFILNAYGVGLDKQRAFDNIVEAAKAGFPLAQANLYRVVTVCGLSLPTGVDVLAFLKHQAVGGSRAALSDLNQLSPEVGKHCRKILDYSTGGVGALWYQPDQWLLGLNQGSFLDADFKLESIGSKSTLADIVVNYRGDRIIHAAAAVGAYSLVKEVLEDQSFDVNQKNAAGETALLCACRASHPNIVLLLLGKGADASLAASNGETPLHWLSSFTPTVNPALVGRDLIDRGGANVDVCTTERISHSHYFKTIDIDIQMPGTPLLWAVHDNNIAAVRFLLSRGSDPKFEAPGGIGPSPLARAAYFHHPECLKIMIEHIENNTVGDAQRTIEENIRTAVNYPFLIKEAVRSADVFSMTLRNGVRCLNMLKETLGYFQEKTASNKDFWYGDQSLLQFAASQGHWEALKFMLDSNWGTDQVN